MDYWIQMESSGHYFFYAYPFCILVLLILLKGRRVRFVIPSILITLIIVNPWFYYMWDRIGLYAYWRVLWIIPVISVIGVIAPAIAETIDRKRESFASVNLLSSKKYFIFENKNVWKALITLLCSVGIVFGGSFVYDTSRGQFELSTGNRAKLPEAAVDVANRILELKDNSRVILQEPLGVYIRQYTGRINTLFGRDLYGHIVGPSILAQKINQAIYDKDYSFISQTMLDEGYDFIVLDHETDEHFILVDIVDEYRIYKAVGIPKVIKKRNELGQVIKKTYVDEDGNPRFGPFGYASVTYEYDNDGNVFREMYSDPEEGQICGIERLYDSYGHVIVEKMLDSDGKPYQHEAGYYGYCQTFDTKGNLISRRYIDSDNMTIMRSDGYSSVEWIIDDNGIKNISFFDIDGNVVNGFGLNLVDTTITKKDGWSMWYTPERNVENCIITIGTVNLGQKEVDDSYTCRFEIEFKDVAAVDGKTFRCATQGPSDGEWTKGNIWNSRLMWIDSPPEDGIYSFTNTSIINEDTVGVSTFRLDFRCDNWKSGSFRIRNVKIEKGDNATEWSPGLQ